MKKNFDKDYDTSNSALTIEPEIEFPVLGDESIMSVKAHGTALAPVPDNLRWGVDSYEADLICNFNRKHGEPAGFFKCATQFKKDAKVHMRKDLKMTFYDSNTGKPLFEAPRNRTWTAFLAETETNGFLTFRDDEVVWDNVRVLPDSRNEVVSVDGTHCGHHSVDKLGNRYCVNISTIAGAVPMYKKSWLYKVLSPLSTPKSSHKRRINQGFLAERRMNYSEGPDEASNLGRMPNNLQASGLIF
jgi:hypothetical protein